MDLQKNRRRPGSGTGPIFRSCVNKSRLQQLPQPKRLSGQVVMNGSSAHLVDANIPFLVDQINRLAKAPGSEGATPLAVPTKSATIEALREVSASMSEEIAAEIAADPPARIVAEPKKEHILIESEITEGCIDAPPFPVARRGRGRPKRQVDGVVATVDSPGDKDSVQRKYKRGINGHQYMLNHRKWGPSLHVNEEDLVVLESDKLWALVAECCDTTITQDDVDMLGTLKEETVIADHTADSIVPSQVCASTMGVGVDIAKHDLVLQELRANNCVKIAGRRLPVYKNHSLDDMLSTRNAELLQAQYVARRELFRLEQLAHAEVVFAKSGVRQASKSYNRTLEAAYLAICARRTLIGYGVRDNDLWQRTRRSGRSGTCSIGAASPDEVIRNGLLVMHSSDVVAPGVHPIPIPHQSPLAESTDMVEIVASNEATKLDVGRSTPPSAPSPVAIDTDPTPTPVLAITPETAGDFTSKHSTTLMINTDPSLNAKSEPVLPTTEPVEVERSASRGKPTGRPGTRMAKGVQLQTKFNIRIYGPDTVFAPDEPPVEPISEALPATTAVAAEPSAVSIARMKKRKYSAMVGQGPCSVMLNPAVSLSTDYLMASYNDNNRDNSEDTNQLGLRITENSSGGNNASTSSASTSCIRDYDTFVASIAQGDCVDCWLSELWVHVRVLAVFRDDLKMTRFIKVRPCSGYSPLTSTSLHQHTSLWFNVYDTHIDNNGNKCRLLAPKGHFQKVGMLNHPHVH